MTAFQISYSRTFPHHGERNAIPQGITVTGYHFTNSSPVSCLPSLPRGPTCHSARPKSDEG